MSDPHTQTGTRNRVSLYRLVRVLFEFRGGPLDGERIMDGEWPADQTQPGTEIVDKNTGSTYRYHLPSSKDHPVYTYRTDSFANTQGDTRPPTT